MTRQELKAEKEKLSRMTWGGKLEYIWSYYSTQILIGCLVLFLLFQGAGILYRNSQEDVLYCLFMDELDVTHQEAVNLEKDFRDYAGIKSKKQVTTFDISLDFTESSFAEASFIKLSGLQSTGTIDVIVTTKSLISRMREDNLYLDLSAVLPEDLFTRLSDRLYETEDGIPLGISLKGSYLEEIMSLEEDSCLAVASMDNDPDTVLQYIRYCFGMEPK